MPAGLVGAGSEKAGLLWEIMARRSGLGGDRRVCIAFLQHKRVTVFFLSFVSEGLLVGVPHAQLCGEVQRILIAGVNSSGCARGFDLTLSKGCVLLDCEVREERLRERAMDAEQGEVLFVLHARRWLALC